ncbi:MAG TPA: ELWxxDGT repeat protein [Thermoanaerobaculia bacterium]|nr:ELWxxDGT repeat protein [Thermoanaerobaculia bacterium]
MRRSLFLLFLAAFCAASASAQAPYLVKDLGNSSDSTPVSSQPASFLSSGNKFFFLATTEIAGREPWVSDSDGIRLVRDINSGSASSNASRFVELTPGVVVFTANDGANGTQLWRSDGTEAGTFLLKVVNASTSPFALSLSYGGKVFFFVNDGTHGDEPWVTDGTVDGTQLLADTRPGSAGNTTGQFFRFGNTTRFFAWGGIWTTDGTPAGTSFTVPVAYRLPAAVTADAIYFFANDGTHGYEPWKSDGTAGGTAMLKDVYAGIYSAFVTSSPAIAATATGAVFFANDGTASGVRLWTTNGSEATTVPLAAFAVSGSTTFSVPLYSTSLGVFFGSESSVWRTDGTEAGTYASAPVGSNYGIYGFFAAFSRIYFPALVNGTTHLFRLDPAPGATATDVRPDVGLTNATLTGGKIWLTGTDATHGGELWVSDDGTTAGTHMVANLALDPARSSRPDNFKAVGPYLYFHPLVPQELWRSDGTSGGTFEVTDVDNNLISPAPFGSLTPFRGDIYYLHGHSEFFRVDGVHGGATKIGDYDFDDMTADENHIYMWNWGWAKLFSSDGTAAGTAELYDPTDPTHLRGNYDSVAVVTDGGYGWILCYHALYRTAGTLETTRRVASVTGNNSYLGGELTAASGLLYATMFSPESGVELWRSDGSGAGSFLVKDANPGPASSNPSNLTAAGRLLFFTATDADHGTELWRSDGTAAGTFMVKDIRSGSASSSLSALTALGEVVYFSANDGTHGAELWKSDGTEAGTVLVRDIAPGTFASKPSALAAAGGKIWFSANDGLHGAELWSSDGTEGGTVMVSDIIPGSVSSSPDQLTAADGTLFFAASTEVEGHELWAVALTTGSVTGTRTAEGNAGTHGLRFTITRHGASSDAASVAYATLPGTATAGTDYTAASGTINFAAGETVKTVDVAVIGDTLTEVNETLFLRLSSPSGVVLGDSTAAGVIEDDDPRADLVAEIVQNAVPSGEADRIIKITNNGPSSANTVTVTFTESPLEFPNYFGGSVQCSNVAASVARCTIPYLDPGASQTISLGRWPVTGIVDPSMPPGRTLTATVTSPVADTDASNNTVSRMTTDNGMLFLPAKLVAGTAATVTFDLGDAAASATSVTLTSSAAGVVISPATNPIAAGQRTATFTVTPPAGVNKTLLSASIGGQSKASLVVPIVANASQTAMLDVAIAADIKSPLEYGQLFIIPARVAARTGDGTTPGGLLTLLDENGNTLQELTLDTAGAAIFTRPQPAPGDYHYRMRYSGDTRFNALTVALPTITITKAAATVDVRMPGLACSNTVQVRIVVSAPEGAPAPTGSVTLQSYPNSLGTFALASNGVAGQAEVTATVTVPNGYQSLNASYSGDGYYGSAIGSKYFSVGCAAMNFVATATSPTTVALSWTQPAASVTQYSIVRGDSNEGPFQTIASTSATSVIDTTALPNHVYVYYVSGYGAYGTPSYNSAPDIASTFVYSNDPLSAGTVVKSAHFTELRAMVTALRTAAGLPLPAFTGSVAAGSTISATHVIELRQSIDAARSRLGLPAMGWVQPNASHGAFVLAATLQELRIAVN